MIKQFIFGCLLIILCEAGFTTIQNWDLETPVRLRYAVITREDTVFGSNIPYLKLNFKLKVNPNINPEVDMIVYHYQNIKLIGLIEEDSQQWCCSKMYYQNRQCSRLDRVFIKDEEKLNFTSIGGRYQVDTSKTILYWSNFSNYDFNPTSQQFNVVDKVEFNKTGVWYLLFLHCSGNDTNKVEVSGEFEWSNPYGYLSGALLPKLPMYVSLAVSFFCLLLVWIIFIIVYREDLMGLQHVVTLATLVAFSENVLWSFDYISYNTDGRISSPINIIGALLTAGKLTVIRTCILLVALGYSITQPSLSRRTTALVLVLTVVYFIDAALEEYVWVRRAMGLEFPEILELIVGAVLVSANLVYVIWVGYSLLSQYKTLKQLKQTQKLDMYKKFIGFLVVFLTLSALLFFIQTGLTVMRRRDELWQLWWIFDAYWEFGYFFVVLLIAVLWWPNQNNKRYAYSVQVDGEELGDIGLPEPDDESEEDGTKLEVQDEDDTDIKKNYTKDDDDSDSDAL